MICRVTFTPHPARDVEESSRNDILSIFNAYIMVWRGSWENALTPFSAHRRVQLVSIRSAARKSSSKTGEVLSRSQRKHGSLEGGRLRNVTPDIKVNYCALLTMICGNYSLLQARNFGVKSSDSPMDGIVLDGKDRHLYFDRGHHHCLRWAGRRWRGLAVRTALSSSKILSIAGGEI